MGKITCTKSSFKCKMAVTTIVIMILNAKLNYVMQVTCHFVGRCSMPVALLSQIGNDPSWLWITLDLSSNNVLYMLNG